MLHPFHLVEPSPWPMLSSMSLFMFTLGSVTQWHGYSSSMLLVMGLMSLLTTMMLWWSDTMSESTFQGYHTKSVQKGMNMGFSLFMMSEVFFFLSMFWAFFHSSLAPSVQIGSVWPPNGLEALNPWEVPLANTLILLSSGASLTWCHHNLMASQSKLILPLIITLFLAILFTCLQGFEYFYSSFNFFDGIFGSCFFFATGFHGLHVMIGTSFLFVGLFSLLSGHFSNTHHIGFESAMIYWHFVDVVWLFLFIFVYWWGC